MTSSSQRWALFSCAHLLLLLAGRAWGAPLQWEAIKPVGVSPSARHSHASVVVPSEQGLLYLFGGCLQEPKFSGTPTQEGKVAGDMWAYDQAAQGWEVVHFPVSSLGCDIVEVQAASPAGRAGHVMMASRLTAAITCGGYGYGEDGRTKTFHEDSAGRMDCWCFTPSGPSGNPRWDPLKFTSSEQGPVPRSGYSMSISLDTKDADMVGKMVIFGGETSNGLLLNDCWILSEIPEIVSLEIANSSTSGVSTWQKFEFMSTYRWTSCDPGDNPDPTKNESSLKPQARYGHQSVYFHDSLYVVGGFAQNGKRVSAKQDIWKLEMIHDPDPRGVAWVELMPTTKTPAARGYHAMWLSGFKIVLHGGTGPIGTGVGAVLSDTWLFDLFTEEWQQKASSAAVPVMSHLSINPLNNAARAISFGGRDSYGKPSGRLYTFAASKSADPWERVYPAGVRPTRRTGNTMLYDQGSSRLITSFGMDSDGMKDDTWILDLTTSMWTCWYGTDPSCQNPAPNSRYSGPGKIAFPTQVQVGLYMILFGGAKISTRSCSELGWGSTGNVAIGENVGDMWAMDTSTYAFMKIEPGEDSADADGKPKSTFLAAMVAVGEFDGRQGFYKQPLVLVGGADLSCASANPPCPVPLPSNDIWVMDVARKEVVGTGDRMAELDGEDDMLQIVLPGWCNSPTMMNVLWIDSWIVVMSAGKRSYILLDAYSDSVPRLRWYMEGTDTGNYIKLVLSPGKSQIMVKSWGPIDANFLGTWHHIAFTLRMARQYSRTSSDPAVIITQAFLFIDGEHIEAGDSFNNLDISKDLMFESGLSEIYVGGTSPGQAGKDFHNLKGAVDNLRVWWPPCPHAEDPTKCNPYGFLFPQRVDGTRQPASGIHDGEVTLGQVAKPVETHMFGLAPDGTEGLLVQVTFDDGISDNIVSSKSSWDGPEQCPGDDSSSVCPGCIEECTFSRCTLFDAGCVEAGASDLSAQAEYAETGTCQCLNVDDCPKNVPGCICPQEKGLHKVCTACLVGICKSLDPEPVWTPPAPPCGVDNEDAENGKCQAGVQANCPVGADVVDCNPGIHGGCDKFKRLTCVDSPADFLDSRGDDCAAYRANPCWCEDAESFVNADGEHAGTACCVCGGLIAVGQGGGNTTSCTPTCLDYEGVEVTDSNGRCEECDPGTPEQPDVWCQCPYGGDPDCCDADRTCAEGKFCDFEQYWGSNPTGICKDCSENYWLSDMGQEAWNSRCCDSVAGDPNQVGASVTCSGSCDCPWTSGEYSGIITDGPWDYPSSARCQWTIQAAPDTEVSLQFTFFDTEGGYDYVYVYECDSVSCCTKNPLVTLDGAGDTWTTYTSSTGYMMVELTSDGGVEQGGFEASWRIPDGDDAGGGDDSSGDGGDGSPSGPSYSDIPGFEDGCVTEVEFNDFVGSDPDAPAFADIVNMDEDSSCMREDDFNAFMQASMGGSDGSESSGDGSPSGASVTCDGSCECPGTSGEYSGTITDGPDNYPSDAACQWTIQAAPDTEVSLQFTFFDTEGGYDYVYVYECDSAACDTKIELVMLDGLGDTGTTYTSSTGYMMVELTSDGSTEQGGFEASWSIPGGDDAGGGDDSSGDGGDGSPSGASVTCDGSCECPGTSGEYSGTITDGPDNYPSDAACQWTIQAAPDTEVSLQFTFFDTEGGYDYVYVYECDSAACDTKIELVMLDGLGDTGTTYTSSTGYMMVELTSDGSTEQGGFEASWSIPGGRRRSRSDALREAETARLIREKERATQAFAKLMTQRDKPAGRKPRRKILSEDEQAAHLAPHEWELWSTHDYYRHFTSSVFLDAHTRQDLLANPSRQFYYHRTTEQIRWDPPQGWEEERASAHQEKLKASSRKLLHYESHNETNHGQGRLCWTDTTTSGVGRKPAQYPEEAPDLPDCPVDPIQRHRCEFQNDPRGDSRPRRSDDGKALMTCEPLDPMFCPEPPYPRGERLYCVEWDCKCYGPGLSGKNISGVLGHAVFDGDKDSLYCGCGTYETVSVDEDDVETVAIDNMEETLMPFENKADQYGELVMPYQCCDDWFAGFQCTTWDYSDPDAPVCMTMFDDHKLKECSAQMCCSAYIEEYGGEEKEILNDNSCQYSYDYYCDEPTWCEFGTDCFDCGTCEGDSGSNDDDSTEIDENSCSVDISGPGTFIGTFEPSEGYPGMGGYGYDYGGHYGGYYRREEEEEAPVVELLSKGHSNQATTSSSTLRIKENFVFRGTFIPDSEDASGVHMTSLTSKALAPPGTEDLQRKSKNASAIEGQKGSSNATVSNARSQESWYVLRQSDNEGPRIRDREARSGVPGGPGGKKAQREAERLAEYRMRTKNSRLHTASPLLPHGRRLLSTNNSNSSNITVADTTGIILAQLALEFTAGYPACVDKNPPITEDDFLGDDSFIKEMLLQILNNRDPSTIPEGTYKAADIQLSNLADDQFMWMWNDWNTDMSKSADVEIRITIADENHREAILDMLTKADFESPWSEHNSRGAQLLCTQCSCPGTSAASSGTITDGPDNYPSYAACQWTIQAAPNTEVSLQFTFFDTEGGYDYVHVYECDSPSCDTKRNLVTLDGAGDTSTTYTSSTGYMMVELTSDSGVEQGGFEASWESNVDASVTCGGETFEKGETFPDESDWIQAPQAVYCGDWSKQSDNDEECDGGASRMSEYNDCYQCKCQPGFVIDELTDGCLCSPSVPETSASVDAVETSAVQGAENNVTLSVQLTIPVAGVDSDGKITDPVVVTISGLSGASAAATYGEVDIGCQHSMATVWTDDDGNPLCKLGLAPLKEESTWRYGKAKWSEAEGTLKFTVLGRLESGGNPMKRRFQLTLTVSNPVKVQDLRRPEVSVCEHRPPEAPSNYEDLGLYQEELKKGRNPISSSGYILGANAKLVLPDLQHDQSVEFRKSYHGVDMVVLALEVPKDSMPENSELIVYGLESELDKGLSSHMARRMPYQETSDVDGAIETVVSAARKTMLKMTLRDRVSGNLLGFLPTDAGVRVKFLIEERVLRRRGECITPETNTVTVCLPGYVGIFKYVDIGDDKEWKFVPDAREKESQQDTRPRFASRRYTELISLIPPNDVSISTEYSVLAVAPCNDFSGTGRAGGDKVCRDPWATSGKADVVLGGGTISKVPAVDSTSRPTFNSKVEFDDYLRSMSSEDATYQPRKPWALVDLSRYPTTVLPPRFGHAAAVVSGSRVLIYGGIGCARMDENASTSGFCLQGKVLQDLWEFDILRWSGSGVPLSLLNLSPVLAGLAGPSLAVLPGEDHRVLTFGGSSVLYPLEELLRNPQAKSDDKFEYRKMMFRASKAENDTINSMEAISYAAASSNETHVMMFGGYLGNTRTSAVHTYSMFASSSDLALQPLLIRATGPSARGVPGVIKPDDVTLLMYGGVRQEDQDGFTRLVASGDLWEFDLSTQSWQEIHETIAAYPPRAFGAFGSMKVGSDIVLFSYGGLKKGFQKGTTFAAVSGEDYQVSDQGRVYFASQRFNPAAKRYWTEFRPTSTSGTPACCNFEYSCNEADRGVGCVPPSRAFQSLNPGLFVAGKGSMIMYGGLDRTGMALGDLWYMDIQDSTEGYSYYIILRNITKAAFSTTHEIEFQDQITTGWGLDTEAACDSRSSVDIKNIYDGPLEPNQDPKIIIEVATEPQNFEKCLKPVMKTEGAFARAINGTFLEGLQLEPSEQQDTGSVSDIRFPWYRFRSNAWCKAGKCLRALCQPKTSTNGPAERDSSQCNEQLFSEDTNTFVDRTPAQKRACYNEIQSKAFSSSDRYLYCYDDWNGDDINDYEYTWPRETNKRGDVIREAGPCGENYFCAAPGRRHGHSTETVIIQGDTTVLMVIGGENGDWSQDSQTLTMDVHVASFTATFGTWAKVLTTDKNGGPCSYDGIWCPKERRDAAVSKMSNDGSSNGRILMFGGLAAGPLMTTSVGRAYLERSTNMDLVALSDLWYLDLQPLTKTCLSGRSKCELLKWVLIDVPGERPMGRWGAGMVLDPSDNLYIIGGNSFDSDTNDFVVLSDIFIFQLRDPYYKYCSATGPGLFAAIAGISTPFYIQCRDAFGDPANSAFFEVDITGKDGQPGMKPAPFSIGEGLYQCEYTAFVTGQYEIQIFVGRGGGEYMDIIEGLDTEQGNSVHDFEFRPISRHDGAAIAPRYYDLTVSPSPTDAATSVAVGDAITSNTVGFVGTFMITAKDEFGTGGLGNRRPGGDTVTSLMRLWNSYNNTEYDAQKLPETGSVLDNKDGSYLVSYRITRAGLYQHAVSLAGNVGAGTPIMLHVSSDVADISRSYIYGQLLKLETGKASAIFIQTRDQYGNNLRWTKEEKPCSGYPLSPSCDQQISYQLCKSAEFQEPCPSDDIEPNVGLSLTYQKGPTGLFYDSNFFPFYGLYEITIYPFVAANFFPMVYHNGTYVKCYFDSGDLLTSLDPMAADPGWLLADACADTNNAEASASAASESRRRVSTYRQGQGWHPVEPMGVIGLDDRVALQERYEEGISEFGMPRAHRRAVTGISWDSTRLQVEQQFEKRDTKLLSFWLALGPVLCFFAGLIVAILHALLDLYEHRRDSKVHALIAEMEADHCVEEFDAADGNAEALVLEDVGDAETVSARTQDSALPPHPQTHHAAVAEAQAQQASTRSPTKPPAAGKGEALANVNADNGFRNGDAKGQVYPTTPGQPSPPSVAQIVIPPALTPAPPPLPPED